VAGKKREEVKGESMGRRGCAVKPRVTEIEVILL
jgi:hypothetical protein